jgi:aromatic ring-opening dioxygenase catalytic subunit (LigB family)
MPGLTLDYKGVFVPFKLMFGDSIDVPVIEVSIDESLSPQKNWQIGKALNELR